MTPLVEAILRSRWFVLLARLALTFVFWSAGLAGIFDFPAKVAEMRQVGLSPAPAYAVAVTLVQLGGAALVISNRWAWLGAGGLGVFLAMTIPIAHPFWTMSEPQRTFEFYVVLEHVSLIGGLMVAAALGQRTHAGR
ncbi:DoxX family protein [Variovorax paradoxus]|uniref:DoxX family protein n=1 Tax=Variovorax paradoxus TaxID=34073 RepID=A0A0D0LPL4_VARPD|nr:DoxX family protein [Variovorax paradoxus]KIQ20489.1 DoxX family protein [Variovorax paradoxus]